MSATATKRIGQARTIASVIRRHPHEARYVPALLRTRGRGTLDQRLPWLPFSVIALLEEHVTPESSVFEYGGGGSTAWFADRAGRVTTVDHDEAWASQLESALGSLPNVDVRYLSVESGARSDYVLSIDSEPESSFDVVVVDGRQRVACVGHAVSKIKPGGLLILDDAERPRYETAFSAVDWPSHTYVGLVPCKDVPGTTTIWQRPRW